MPTKPEIVPEQTNSNRWPCTVASAIIHALHSTAIYVAPSVLVSPIRQSLNLSVEQAILPLIAFRTVQTVFLLPAGYLLDKIGPQRCLRFSLIMACILAPLLPFATSLSQLIILQSVAALTKLMGGVSALLLLASLNFPSGKGLPTATSMLISGYSFAGFLAPAVIGVVSQQFGWRIALGALSALFAVVTVPATLVFLKEPDNRYRKKSLSQIFTEIPVVKRLQSFFTTFGKEDHSHLSSHSNARVALAARQKSDSEDEKLLTTGLVSTLVMVVAYSFAMHLVFDHLIVFLTEDIGIAFNVATRYMSVLNLVALGTKLVLGPIAERVNKTKLLMGAGVLGVFASLLLFDVSLGTIVVTASLPKIMVFSVLCKLHSIASCDLFCRDCSCLVVLTFVHFDICDLFSKHQSQLHMPPYTV